MVNFVPMASVSEEFGGIDLSIKRPLEDVQKGYTQFRERDVIVAKITPCMENGKLAVVPVLDSEVAYGSTEFHVLRANDGVKPSWIAYFVAQSSFRRQAQRNMSGSAGQLRVPVKWLEDQIVPIAPPNEQTRITAKIEELFSDLDAGVAALERARAKLKRYRAAVLKAAVEGRLTAEWRKEHPNVEPASKLLERILTERRRKWEEAQLARLRERNARGQAKHAAQDKTPPKGWKDKYAEPAKPESNVAIGEIPNLWITASMDQITNVITSGSRDWTQYYGKGNGVFLMAQNVRPLFLDLKYRQLVDPPIDSPDRRRSQVEKDDLLVTIVGANTGDVCIVNRDLLEHYVCQSVALMRPVLPELGGYMNCYMNSHEHGQRYYRRYIYGAGRPHLSFEQLKMTPVILPPIEEQFEIVRILQEYFVVFEKYEILLTACPKRAMVLRQAILKRAFEGKLVPQDPSDEPAAVLLERIRNARAAEGTQRAHKRRKSPA